MESESAYLKAGVAKVNITPPVGFPLAGYAARDQVSQSIEDELHCKALVLDNGPVELVLVTSDLIRITPGIAEQVRTTVERQIGIPGDHVLLCASHTHFGPVLKPGYPLPRSVMDGFDETYVRQLAQQMIGAVHMAYANRRDAHIAAGLGHLPQAVFNRRTRKPDGKVTMSWQLPASPEADGLSFGPVDSEVGVLRVEGMDGELIAALINFACHPVCGVDQMYAISADYPGHAMQLVEMLEQGICLFALGCAGNVVPIEREGPSRRWIGTALGAEALKVLQTISRHTEAGPIALEAQRRTIELPTKPGSGLARDRLVTEIQAIHIGPVVLIGLPGEVFVEFGLDIKQRVPAQNVFVISLCGDGFGYVPIQPAYAEGGYEPEVSPLAPGAGEILTDAAVELALRASR